VGPHHRSVEWDNHLPEPPSCAVFHALQDITGPFGCQGTLSTHIQLVINPDLQISFCGAALQSLIP